MTRHARCCGLRVEGQVSAFLGPDALAFLLLLNTCGDIARQRTKPGTGPQSVPDYALSGHLWPGDPTTASKISYAREARLRTSFIHIDLVWETNMEMGD